MSKTNRLIRGELNKILMRPILYVVSILLVVAIIFSFTRFDIKSRSDDFYTISGNTKAEVFNNFYSNTAEFSKIKIDEQLAQANATLDYYQNLNTIDDQGNISPDRATYNLKIDIILNSYKTYYYQAIQNELISTCNYYRTQILFELQNLREHYTTAAEQESPNILITINNANQLITLIDQCIQKLSDKNQNFNKLDTHTNIYNYLFNGERLNTIDKILHNIKDVLLDDQTILHTKKLILTTQQNLQKREQAIVTAHSDQDVEIDPLKDLVLNYYLYADQMLLNFNTTLLFDPIKNYNDTYIHSLKGSQYNNLYSYQLQETLTSSEFLINNNANYNDYASMYNTNMASTPEANAFDFLYSGMEFCSFIIIIFCVVIGAGMVAGEQNNGTLKLLAIRPYKRHKILTSKILATLLFGLILALFSMIILFLIGWLNYGISMTTILAIFNATIPFEVSPFLAMLIYLACLMFKILAYILIAIAISVIFRSNVGAVSISIFIFFFSTIFGQMFIHSTWYAFLPFSNFDLFKYLGGNFTAGASTSTLSSTAILFNTNFIFSTIISVLTLLILTIVTYKIFNKREIK